MFKAFSAGLKTGRDAWCYHYSRAGLDHNVSEALRQYEEARRSFATYCAAQRSPTLVKRTSLSF